jgi:hypothetical protein
MQVSIISNANSNKYSNIATSSGIETETFDDILKKKQDSQMGAKEFLNKLTPNELYQVQKINHLADRINVQGLSQEGAENLFLAPVDQYKTVDLNNDGIVEIGAAKMMIFPPPNSPESVKQAWKEASKNMTGEQKISIETNFLAKQIEKNAYRKPDGTWGIHEPGDAGWVNIYGNSEDSIVNLCKEIIYRLENPLETPSSEKVKKNEYEKSVFNKFISLIEENK